MDDLARVREEIRRGSHAAAETMLESIVDGSEEITSHLLFDYLKKHNLPYHPLWEQGYVSIGDMHTTRPLTADMTEEETRFFGLKRECGLHIGENI